MSSGEHCLAHALHNGGAVLDQSAVQLRDAVAQDTTWHLASVQDFITGSF